MSNVLTILVSPPTYGDVFKNIIMAKILQLEGVTGVAFTMKRAWKNPMRAAENTISRLHKVAGYSSFD